ncbi:MAG: DUF261 family protein, partial [Mycoplasma sp.]|nr:DUF261 family protein [Mycoplasma sp.]
SDLLSNKKDPSNIESEPKISPIIKSTTRITMPEQNKFKLDAINKWGCYFLCLVFIQALIKAAKTNKDQNLSRDYIELMFKGLNGSNINKINAFIKNPNGILSEFQVNNDIFFTDEFITRESIPLYFHNTLFVARYKYKEFNHFCIVDKN